MRLESVRIQNFGPFRDFSANLAELAGPLVAIVGANGAGKSTFAELALPGTLYRSTPTRGSLVDLATTRDAVLTTRVVNGAPWTIRHLVDKVSGKSEVSVVGADGAPALPDTKVRSFDAWAAKHLPAPEVLYSCMFAPQGAGGFLGAKPGERKAILLRILGVEGLEAKAEVARERARTTRSRLEVLAAWIADERDRGGDVEAAGAAHAAALAEVDRIERELTDRRRLLAELTTQARAVEEARRAAAERSAVRARLYSERGTAAARVADLEKRLANNRAVLADAAAIRSAVVQAQALRDEIAEYAAAAERADSLARESASQVASADARLRGLVSRIERARETLASKDAVRLAVASIPTLEAEAERAATEHRAAEDALEALQGHRAEGADERIRFLRQGLEQIVVRAGDPYERAQATLGHDDASVKMAAALPQRLKDAQAATRAAFSHAEGAAKKVAEAKAVAARGEAMGAAARDLEDAEREHAAVATERTNADARHAEALTTARRFRERAGGKQPELDAATKLAARAEPLSHAEARLSELEPQHEVAKADFDRLGRDLEAHPELEAPAAVSLTSAQALVTEGEGAARRAAADAAVAAGRLDAAKKAGERLAELDQERAGVELELADWNRLAKDLGKDGLQAAEIDAAGPELTALVNDLMHTCHGPRFTVRVETQRASADGKHMLEGCDVVVLDTERGREAQGETFSGGERVIIGEALSLALSMLACRRAGLTGITLVRDESGAALDPVNGRVYVAMLRRAAALVRADKVLFVSHSPEVVEMADARIEVG